MDPDPKQKRERFQQLTQNPKVKTRKAFAADLRKSKIHPTVKKSLNRSQAEELSLASQLLLSSQRSAPR